MSAKGISAGIEVHDLGMRRLYVKLSTGFVLHNDDLTAEELLAIAEDIARRERKPRREAAVKIERLSTSPCLAR